MKKSSLTPITAGHSQAQISETSWTTLTQMRARHRLSRMTQTLQTARALTLARRGFHFVMQETPAATTPAETRLSTHCRRERRKHRAMLKATIRTARVHRKLTRTLRGRIGG
ncbi:MAG TPA: hypothetical protein VF627_05180 [Abditibacterium sp.]|jgi:hypothetical protein